MAPAAERAHVSADRIFLTSARLAAAFLHTKRSVCPFTIRFERCTCQKHCARIARPPADAGAAVCRGSQRMDHALRECRPSDPSVAALLLRADVRASCFVTRLPGRSSGPCPFRSAVLTQAYIRASRAINCRTASSHHQL